MNERGPKDRELWRRAGEVFDGLLTLSPEERLAALEGQGLEPGVEGRVRRLIAAGAVEGGPLDRPIEELIEAGPELAGTDPSDGLTGRRLGPFELDEVIGRGGMSVVFRAHRTVGGFDQQVAVKILTVAHLASSARMQQEKEILARLRHPHIATLVDGGVEDDGTTWLAMELVEGETIDRHCANSCLDARAVVELFLDVCEAVAHAHRSLVVHRDLKPANILVDAEGQVRLLDFGIAKLLAEADPEASQTRAFTLRYAAPEQFTGEALTTATDVYGLGGVLYRLLAGSPPRPEGRGLASVDATFLPERPSRCPSAIAGLDRDLETVSLKALRPEPDRRYPSAAELRDDLRRWLDRLPVVAVPDSFGYRMRKLYERRRAAVIGGLLLAAALGAGTATTWWQAARARDQAARAIEEADRATAVTDFLLGLFQFAEPDRSQGESLTVREALDAGARQLESQLEEQPEVRVALLAAVGEIYRRLGLYDEAVPLLDRAVELSDGLAGDVGARVRLGRATLALDRFDLEAAGADVGGAVAASDPHLRSDGLRVLGALRRAEGRFDEAARILEEALALEGAAPEPERGRIARIRLGIGDVAFKAGDLTRAGAAYHQALEEVQAAHEGDHTEVALILASLGLHAAEAGELDLSLAYFEEALGMRERLLGEAHPDVAETLSQVAQLYRESGRFDEAEERYRRALALQRARLGEDHEAVLTTLNSLAVLAYDRGDVERAAELLDDAVERARRLFGPNHPTVADILVNLASVCRVLGQVDRAEPYLQEALSIQRRTLGPKTLAIAHTYSHLGNLALHRGRFDEAEAHYGQAFEATVAATNETHPETLSARSNLAGVSFAKGRFQEAAERYREVFATAEVSLAEGHPLHAVLEGRLARSLLRVDRARDALGHAERAAQRASELYPEEHSRRLEIEAVLGGALLLTGQTERGEALLRNVQARLDAGGRSPAAGAEVSLWLRPE